MKLQLAVAVGSVLLVLFERWRLTRCMDKQLKAAGLMPEEPSPKLDAFESNKTWEKWASCESCDSTWGGKVETFPQSLIKLASFFPETIRQVEKTILKSWFSMLQRARTKGRIAKQAPFSFLLRWPRHSVGSLCRYSKWQVATRASRAKMTKAALPPSRKMVCIAQ